MSGMRVSLLLFSVSLFLLSCSSLSPETVTRRELFTPTARRAVNPADCADMMYCGSDSDYDYFMRCGKRFRVPVAEQTVPQSVRTAFTDWQGGKLYRECLTEAVSRKLAPAEPGAPDSPRLRNNLRTRSAE